MRSRIRRTSSTGTEQTAPEMRLCRDAGGAAGSSEPTGRAQRSNVPTSTPRASSLPITARRRSSAVQPSASPLGSLSA